MSCFHTTHLRRAEAAQVYQSRRSELQGIASKIGELEGEADEHKLVIDTLTEASKADPDRKCFRLIGGVLVERTVKEVLPALQTNLEGVSVLALSDFPPDSVKLDSDTPSDLVPFLQMLIDAYDSSSKSSKRSSNSTSRKRPSCKSSNENTLVEHLLSASDRLCPQSNQSKSAAGTAFDGLNVIVPFIVSLMTTTSSRDWSLF
ncbi:hypothetical protein PHSY_005948 [Pseudozyma hubeiensis SY62]|uniref:Uncharacterized protein n=1 Tax=Pseudozyma hubeiensis (strain SY62) TaxID=1305764 RepID=R9PJU6_PSEHS|nr:hypothetical protein PHSY_005948 [Pseudozyma hubeiensis SY62]GAC98355.1 hypothetical protein PHSY_005948 [Pseudozyma hubeiensis SY62]